MIYSWLQFAFHALGIWEEHVQVMQAVLACNLLSLIS